MVTDDLLSRYGSN